MIAANGSGRPLFRVASSYLLLAWTLVLLGLAELPVALVTSARWWTALLMAIAAFAAGGLFWWRFRFNPCPLDELPEMPSESVIIDLWNLLGRCAPFLVFLLLLGIGGAFSPATAAVFAGVFAAWGVQELRRVRLLGRWEDQARATLVAEAPSVFVVGRVGREYRLDTPSPGQ